MTPYHTESFNFSGDGCGRDPLRESIIVEGEHPTSGQSILLRLHVILC